MDSFSFGVGNRWRRVLRRSSTTPEQLEEAAREVEAIRSELADLRHRLSDVSQIESQSPRDSVASDAESALTLIIMALHSLVDQSSDRNLYTRAAHVRKLWADAEANPDDFVIED